MCFPNRSDTNLTSPAQKMARGWNLLCTTLGKRRWTNYRASVSKSNGFGFETRWYPVVFKGKTHNIPIQLISIQELSVKFVYEIMSKKK